MSVSLDPRQARWLRLSVLVGLLAGWLLVMPVAAQSDSSLICDAGVGKSLINSVAQFAFSAYGVITILAIIADRLINAAPWLPQKTQKAIMKWRGKVLGGAVVMYVLLPIGYQIALTSGVPLPTCIDRIPL